MTHFDDDTLRAALATARSIEPTDAEVDAARSRTHTLRPDAQRRALAVALTAMALIGGSALAVPASHGAIQNVFSSLTAWVSGDDAAAPGRAPRSGDDAPPWLRDVGGRPRIVAENDGVRLYAVRTAGGRLTFGLDGSVAITNTLDGWRKQLGDRAIVVLGPGGVHGQPFDRRGRRPLFGATSASVSRVQLQYASGPPLTQTGIRGGFVLLADPSRPLREIVALNTAGDVVDRADVRHIDLRVCRDERGCPPGEQRP